MEYIAKLEELGGAVRAIENGFQAREIHEAAFRWQKSVESEETVVVGVNRYTGPDEAETPIFRVDESLHAERAERLRALRDRRDGVAVERALAAVETAAKGNANLMPPIVEAVESLATLGEISDRLRNVFGTFRESF